MTQRKNAATRRGEAGFTMVEMLIALVLVTIVLSGTLAMQVSVMQSNRKSRQTSAAVALAQRHVEEFLSSAYDALTTVTQNWVCYDTNLRRIDASTSFGPCPTTAPDDATTPYGCTNVASGEGPWAYRVCETITGDAVTGYQLYVNVEERTPESSDTSRPASYEYKSYYYSGRRQ